MDQIHFLISPFYLNMETKICTGCKEIKLMDYFYNHKNTIDGKQWHCKLCIKNRKFKDKIKNSIKGKIYYQNNKEKIHEYSRNWREENPNYFKENWNKEKYLITQKEWHLGHRDQLNDYHKNYKKERRKKDPIFKLYCSVSSRIKFSLKSKNKNKNLKTHQILGCKFEEFKQYIESLWQPWMNWDNYGLYNGEINYGWDIDHIIPISSAVNEEEIYKFSHYTNLQPLCSYINRVIKRAK